MTGGLRTRAILGRHWRALVLAALVLAVVGAVGTYGAYATSNERVEERTTESWRVQGTYAHGATVLASANTTTFEPGSTVENRDVYFERVMPTLNGSLALAARGADGPVDLRVRSRLVVESVATARDDETVYWRQSHPLGETDVRLAPGESTRVPFSVDVRETFADARNESARLGSPGQIEARVVFDVTAAGSAIDDTESFTFDLPLEPEGGVYRVEDRPERKSFNETTTVTVATPPGPLRAVGGPAAVLFGAGGALALLVARRRDALSLSDVERAWLAYHDDRSDYADWITAARLPEQVHDRPVVVVDTLADLADVAIDVDERVVHDRDRETYAVVHDDLLYVFDPPADPNHADALADTDAVDVPERTAEPLDTDDLPFGDADDSLDERTGLDDAAVFDEADDDLDEADEAQRDLDHPATVDGAEVPEATASPTGDDSAPESDSQD
jgi:hypothetical protein